MSQENVVGTAGFSAPAQIQQLQRLETVVFNMDKIISGGWESRYIPTFLAGERLLLVVDGDVTAGVDLGRNARTTMTSFLRGLGFEQPEFW
jgi:Protein of unknown function (DUF4230)